MKLNLGCGDKKMHGYINIDICPDFKPDRVDNALELKSYANGAIDEIVMFHLFEHLTYDEAIIGLKRWYELLREGGKLIIEMPDANRCLTMIGRGKERRELGVIGIYGYEPDIKKHGRSFTHKFLWARRHIIKEYKIAGFKKIEIEDSRKNRPAAKYHRDMRVKGIK